MTHRPTGGGTAHTRHPAWDVRLSLLLVRHIIPTKSTLRGYGLQGIIMMINTFCVCGYGDILFNR